ncbi:MAG: conjugal transfer protein TraL [Oscillospiraceae bacterium]
MSITSTILLLLIFLAACAVMYHEGFLDSAGRITAAIFFVTAAFALRIIMLPTITSDYTLFLQKWVDYFRQSGGFSAIADEIGNYNLPYLYFLALFSYIPVDDLYLVKLLSIAFDVLLAWGVSGIVSLYVDSKNRQLAAFIVTLFWPTVLLNGAYWGQCDSIFAAFGVMAFYMALAERPRLSLMFAALSLAFKVQAVFLLPIYAVFLITRHIRLRDLLIFPLTYLATVLPAIALGHPIWDAVFLYFRQVNGATASLNFNSASAYAFIPYGYTAEWLDYGAYIGIALALALVYTVLLWTIAKGRSVNKFTLLGFSALITLGIPFFLPYMHDRYFFLADIFTLILAFISPAYFSVAMLCVFGSLLGYYAYLYHEFFLTMNFGAAAMLVALGVITVYIQKSFGKAEKPI